MAVYNPNADNRSTHDGYDVKQLGDAIRSLVVLKNRYGETNIEDCCLFHGKLGIFTELPPPNEIYDYAKLLDFTKKDRDNKNDSKINFTL